MSELVATGKVVSFHYTLRSDAGEVIDSSDGQGPLVYMHGAGNIVPGLEEALEGKTIGDSLNVSIKAADGYGEKQGPGPQPVPRGAFPEGMPIERGMQFAVEGPDGSPIPVWVTSADDESVHIDINHPLAGETLHFAVAIVEVRDATDEERSHGHVHDAHSHGH